MRMDRARKSHDLARALVFGFCTALLVWLEIASVQMHTVEWKARDWLMRYGRLTPKNPQLVFLAIDQPSITLDGVFPEDFAASPELRSIKASGWPWTRDIYATVIDKLAASGARVIAFDLLFPTPREGDAKLREALVRHADRVVIGSSFVDSDRANGGSTILMAPAESLVPPGSASDDVGFVNYWPDADGIVRRAFYRRTANEVNGLKSYPGQTVQLSLAARILQKLGLPVPETDAGLMIRFTDGVRHNTAFQPHSLYGIFVPAIWNSREFQSGALFKNKVVIVGPEGDWSKDQLNTTFSLLAGPTLHLHAVNAAIHHEFIGEVSDSISAFWIAIAGLLAWLLAIRVRQPFPRLVLLTALTLLVLAAAWILYNGWLGLPPTAMFFVGICVALVGPSFLWFSAEFLYEWRERQRTRRTLERYVSKNLVREILDNPESYFNTLTGVRKPVAVMFTDLRGFTALTEHADSQQIVMQLNEYFSEMVQHVFDQQGTLDKFIGDAIMAEWGNLHSEGPQRDVEQSVTAALKMREGLQKLNASWKERGLPCLGMGLGINHGEVIVGNIGSSSGIEKMDPTVIGDAVNLASRLESLTKEYGLDLILGESAGRLAAEAFHVQEVDFVQVKGRSQPLAIFTVHGRKADPLEPARQQYLEHFAAGLAAYRATHFVAAQAEYRKCLEGVPNDALAAIFSARCEALIAAPPTPGWDGVFVMTKK
jgi:adenylate cyclase